MVTLDTAEGEIAYGGQEQTGRHEQTRIAPIGDRAHDKLRQPVSDCRNRQKIPYLRLGVTDRLAEFLGNGSEVVSNQIKESVSNEGGFHDPPSELTVSLGNLPLGQTLDLRRRFI
jgi:hypothetical protein